MREQKNDEKGYFFQAVQCAAPASLRLGKLLFLQERGMLFTNLLNAVIRGLNQNLVMNLVSILNLLSSIPSLLFSNV